MSGGGARGRASGQGLGLAGGVSDPVAIAGACSAGAAFMGASVMKAAAFMLARQNLQRTSCTCSLAGVSLPVSSRTFFSPNDVQISTTFLPADAAST